MNKSAKLDLLQVLQKLQEFLQKFDALKLANERKETVQDIESLVTKILQKEMKPNEQMDEIAEQRNKKVEEVTLQMQKLELLYSKFLQTIIEPNDLQIVNAEKEKISEMKQKLEELNIKNNSD